MNQRVHFDTLVRSKVNLGLANQVADDEDKSLGRMAPGDHLRVRILGKEVLGLGVNHQHALGVDGQHDVRREVPGILGLYEKVSRAVDLPALDVIQIIQLGFGGRIAFELLIDADDLVLEFRGALALEILGGKEIGEAIVLLKCG